VAGGREAAVADLQAKEEGVIVSGTATAKTLGQVACDAWTALANAKRRPDQLQITVQYHERPEWGRECWEAAAKAVVDADNEATFEKQYVEMRSKIAELESELTIAKVQRNETLLDAFEAEANLLLGIGGMLFDRESEIVSYEGIRDRISEIMNELAFQRQRAYMRNDIVSADRISKLIGAKLPSVHEGEGK
jgi:hypothetical protein